MKARERRSRATFCASGAFPAVGLNVGLWQAEDATALHHAPSCSPLFPWMDIHVRPLAARTRPILLQGAEDVPNLSSQTCL